jgi:hypothetical protein
MTVGTYESAEQVGTMKSTVTAGSTERCFSILCRWKGSEGVALRVAQGNPS